MPSSRRRTGGSTKALAQMIAFLREHPGVLEEVRFVLYTRENQAAYTIFAHRDSVRGVFTTTTPRC
jgi:hypothetical protein